MKLYRKSKSNRSELFHRTNSRGSLSYIMEDENTSRYFSTFIPQTAFRYAKNQQSAGSHERHQMDLSLPSLRDFSSKISKSIILKIRESDDKIALILLPESLLTVQKEARLTAIFSQLGLLTDSSPNKGQVPGLSLSDFNSADSVWQAIEEKVLNNIKFYILKTFPAQILHHFNPKLTAIVKQYGRYLPNFVAQNEIQDLKTIAQLEFLETLKVWNPNKHSDIWPLAYARINGAMKDHIRYITKSDPSNIYDWVTDAAYFYLTLNRDTQHDREIENSLQLKEVLNCLPEREKRIVIDHIYRDQTFQQISQKIQVSESQISRIYKKALEKIKKELAKSA